MAEQETAGILVLFGQDILPAQARVTLASIGDMVLGWAQAFDGETLYGVLVLQEEADEWKETLDKLPGVIWTERMSRPPTFEPDEPGN